MLAVGQAPMSILGVQMGAESPSLMKDNVLKSLYMLLGLSLRSNFLGRCASIVLVYPFNGLLFFNTTGRETLA